MRIAKTMWLAVSGILLTLVVGAAWALPPRISWEPGRLAPASIAPGESVTYSVTFTHTGYLPIPATKQLRIVPEGALAHYVTVTPPKFPPVLKRGDRVTVQLTVSAPADVPLSVVRDEILLERILPNGKTMEVFRAEALPVELTFSPFPLPSDPGEAGKVTLQGIDANEDGVRDDIERWVVFNYPSSEKARLARFQLAKTYGAMLTAGTAGNVQDALTLYGDGLNATNCIRYTSDPQGLRRDFLKEPPKLLAEMLNTRERSVAYGAYNALLAGKVINHPIRSAPEDNRLGCAGFDPDMTRD